MGATYRARDSHLQREVAIRALPSFTTSAADLRQRFQHEPQAAAALNHPNILAVFQMGSCGGWDGVARIASRLEQSAHRVHLRTMDGGWKVLRVCVGRANLGSAAKRRSVSPQTEPDSDHF
jgi:hypothetical protein